MTLSHPLLDSKSLLHLLSQNCLRESDLTLLSEGLTVFSTVKIYFILIEVHISDFNHILAVEGRATLKTWCEQIVVKRNILRLV